MAAVLVSAAASTARAAGPDGAGDGTLCRQAISAAEQHARLPGSLLGAIAVVESGRPDGQTGRVTPWPWTINVAGTGHFFRTKAEAIAGVMAARAAGVMSIDVGCMQVNLLHHPAAFASLEQAFDPEANTVYAAAFLTRLFAQTGSWPSAAGAYHSQTPGVADAYQQRVMGLWPLAARYGGIYRSVRADTVDPRGVYTPEFRAQLQMNAADRARWVEMGLVRDQRPPRLGPQRAYARGQPSRGRLYASLLN